MAPETSITSAATLLGGGTVLVSAIVSAAVSYGLQKGRIATAERDITSQGDRIEKLEDEVHAKADRDDLAELKAAIAQVNARLDQMLALMVKRQ